MCAGRPTRVASWLQTASNSLEHLGQLDRYLHDETRKKRGCFCGGVRQVVQVGRGAV